MENPVSVHDFHATMLHLLGVDAAKLAVKYQGLDVRLTGPEGGRVVATSSPSRVNVQFAEVSFSRE